METDMEKYIEDTTKLQIGCSALIFGLLVLIALIAYLLLTGRW